MKIPSWRRVLINLGKRVKSYITGFMPSKYSSSLFLIFFISGFLFTFLDPVKAQSTFSGGFLVNNLTAQIVPPNDISFHYLLNQFVFFLGKISMGIFFNNLMVSLMCIFSGFLIIPIILINLFVFLGSVFCLVMFKYGVFKGIILFGGSFHLIFELWAALLVIDAFINFYSTIINSAKQKSMRRFTNGIRDNFIPLILRVVVLLFIAAILEVFWSTWWVYILTHPYISWLGFYTGLYSCMF